MTRAHLTADGDRLTMTLSWGATVTGSLLEIAAACRRCVVAADDLTMPDKDDDESPTTGQRIALYAVLKQIVRIGPHGLVDRADFATAAELGPGIDEADLVRWRESGEIFAVEHNGVTLYPRYGFDTASPRTPLRMLREILTALEMDDWHAATWFMSGCGMLGSQRPQDVIASDAEAVLAAAIDQAMGITHG